MSGSKSPSPGGPESPTQGGGKPQDPLPQKEESQYLFLKYGLGTPLLWQRAGPSKKLDGSQRTEYYKGETQTEARTGQEGQRQVWSLAQSLQWWLFTEAGHGAKTWEQTSHRGVQKNVWLKVPPHPAGEKEGKREQAHLITGSAAATRPGHGWPESSTQRTTTLLHTEEQSNV